MPIADPRLAAPSQPGSTTIPRRASPAASPWPTALQWLICATPFILSIAYWPALFEPVIPLKRALLVTLGCAAFAMAAAGGLLRRQPLLWWLPTALYAAAVAASWAYSIRRDMAPHTALVLLAPVLLAWAAASVLREHRGTLLEAIAGAAALQALLAAFEWGTGFDPFSLFAQARVGFGRQVVIGTFDGPEALAMFIAAAFPATLTLAADRRRTLAPRLLWVALAALEIAVIGGTACRVALAAALTGAAVLAWQRRPKLRRRALVAVAAGIVLLGLALAAGVVAARRNNKDLGAGAEGRLFLWGASLWHRPGSPVTGAGPGTFHFFYLQREGLYLHTLGKPEWTTYAGNDSSPNNDFILALVETGWLGVAALVLLLAAWARLAMRIRDSYGGDQYPMTAASIAAVAGLCLAALLESPLGGADTSALFWLWLALPVSLAARSSPRATRPRVLWLRGAAAAAAFAVVAWFAFRPVRADWWTARALRAEFANRYPEALYENRRALAVSPVTEDTWFHVSRVLAKAGDLDAALASLADADRWDAHPRVTELRIQLLYRTGRFDEALRLAREGVRIYPWAPVMRGWEEALSARERAP